MPQKRHRPEEIIARPRKAEVLLGEGKKVAEVFKTSSNSAAGGLWDLQQRILAAVRERHVGSASERPQLRLRLASAGQPASGSQRAPPSRPAAE